MSTIRQIAKHLSLSPATVSRALHDPESPFVSATTRVRVQEAATWLGYVPNGTGRALSTGRTHLISLWINDPYSPYYAQVGRHLYRESERRGYHPVVRAVSTQETGPAELRAPDGLADGLLVLDVREPLQWFLDTSPSFRLPLVGLGALCLETTDHVRVDLYAGAVEAVQHLVATRSGRIVALMYHEADPRTKAYFSVMRDAAREPEVLMITDETRATNRELVGTYVRDHGCPSALFCQNDDVAIAAYRGLMDLGMRVPEDVALVGCDGIEDGEYLATPLSTVTHPIDRMCKLAWEFLANRMADPTAPQQSAVLPSTLVIRASSA